jgi:hypothetical protein
LGGGDLFSIQRLPFLAGVAAAPPSGLAAFAVANGIQPRRRLRSAPYDAISWKASIDKGRNS